MLCLQDSEMSFFQFHISKVSRNKHTIRFHARFPIGCNFKLFYDVNIRRLAFIKSICFKEATKCTCLLTSLWHRKRLGCSSTNVSFTSKTHRQNMLSSD
jgi:hypothetical protein